MTIVDDLERLSALHKSGALTDAEFQSAKAALLQRQAAEMSPAATARLAADAALERALSPAASTPARRGAGILPLFAVLGALVLVYVVVDPLYLLSDRPVITAPPVAPSPRPAATAATPSLTLTRERQTVLAALIQAEWSSARTPDHVEKRVAALATEQELAFMLTYECGEGTRCAQGARRATYFVESSCAAPTREIASEDSDPFFVGDPFHLMALRCAGGARSTLKQLRAGAADSMRASDNLILLLPTGSATEVRRLLAE